jgi:hypothetical protein
MEITSVPWAFVEFLGDRAGVVLCRDLLGMMRDEGLSMPKAEAVLIRRIGGIDNLPSYIDCLLVQDARK